MGFRGAVPRLLLHGFFFFHVIILAIFIRDFSSRDRTSNFFLAFSLRDTLVIVLVDVGGLTVGALTHRKDLTGLHTA